jgi:hypothetical protein
MTYHFTNCDVSSSHSDNIQTRACIIRSRQQRVEGIASPESSLELSPTDFQMDLEVGRCQNLPPPHPRLPLPSPSPSRPRAELTAQALQRQESTDMNPFLPDLDPELDPEPAAMRHADDVKGYNL